MEIENNTDNTKIICQVLAENTKYCNIVLMKSRLMENVSHLINTREIYTFMTDTTFNLEKNGLMLMVAAVRNLNGR